MSVGNILLTILNLQKVRDQILHEAVLLRHVALEVDHLIEHVLIVIFKVADMGSHIVLSLN